MEYSELTSTHFRLKSFQVNSHLIVCSLRCMNELHSNISLVIRTPSHCSGKRNCNVRCGSHASTTTAYVAEGLYDVQQHLSVRGTVEDPVYCHLKIAPVPRRPGPLWSCYNTNRFVNGKRLVRVSTTPRRHELGIH